MKKLEITLIIAIMLLFSFPKVSICDFYKWVDENGVSHFSESPPQDTEVEAKYESHKSSEKDNSSSKTPEKYQDKSSSSEKNKEKPNQNLSLSPSDITGKWEFTGYTKSLSDEKLLKPSDPQSWEFKSSGTVTYRIGNNKNDFKYEIKVNRIITKPFGSDLVWIVVEKSDRKMVWKAEMGHYVHLTRTR